MRALVLLLLASSSMASPWFSPAPSPPVLQPTFLPSLLSSQQALRAGGGFALLLQAKHVKHTVLFAQAVRFVAAPALADAAHALSLIWSNLTAAAASLPPVDLAEADVLLRNAKRQLSETRRTMAEATAGWRNGTLDQKSFSNEISQAKSSAAALASQIAHADATLSFVAAAMRRVDAVELYSTLSTPLAAIATALTLSTTSSATAVLHGCPLGADLSRVLLTQLSHFTHHVMPPSMAHGLEDAITPLSPEKRQWALTAVDASAGMVGYFLARRAKGAAATLSAVALGAATLVSSARAVGFDTLLTTLLVGGKADETPESETASWFFLASVAKNDAGTSAWSEARWQQAWMWRDVASDDTGGREAGSW